MGFLDDLKKASSAQKVIDLKTEERLYEFVQRELESGSIRSGLWTKARATSNGTDRAAIEQRYIQLRFEQLKAEGELLQRFAAEIEEEVNRSAASEQSKFAERAKPTPMLGQGGKCRVCGPWWKSGRCWNCGKNYGPKR